MKTTLNSRAHYIWQSLASAIVLGLLAVPAARAGLAIELDLDRGDYQGYQYYQFGCSMNTNGTSPDISYGDYFVVSPGWPTNASASATLFHFDATGFNQISSSGSGDFSQFDAPNFSDSFIQNITNGKWSIFVTNAVTTNVYYFSVTAHISSNAIPPVSIIYPPNNALNVTNQPTILWQSPTNYDEQILYGPDFGYDLPVTQQSYSDATFAAGLNGITVDTYYHSSTGVVCSVPTNSAGSPLSGWVSTWRVWDYANVQFTVGGPSADFNAALGTTNLPWATMGYAAWFSETTNTANNSSSAAQSGSVTGGQFSTLSVTVTGPGTLTFDWSSIAKDPNQGFACIFDIDGNYAANINGDTDWFQEFDPNTGEPFVIPAGQHVLTWEVNAGGDTDPTEAGFLANVSYVSVPSPSLTVTATPSSGLASLTVQFTSPSTDSQGNTVTNWNWDFGDGGTSTAQSPSHTFTTGGLFSPSLIAYSTYGTTPLTINGPGTINVSKPSLAVSATPPSGFAPLTVQFFSPITDSAGNTVTSWNWTFGDGGSSTAQSPLHTYTNTGSFSPALTAYSTYGPSPLSVTGLGTLSVTPPPPSPGVWTVTGGMKAIRALETLTLLPDGKVLASAGEGAGYFSVATAELYDPALGTWANTGSLAADRYGHTATLLGNGKVLVAGGIQSFSTYGNIASTELYNPMNGTWGTNNAMTTSRYGHTATLLGNGKVLVAGGQAHDASGYTGLASVELYDPNLGVWTLTGTMPNVHQFHSATLLTNGWVLVAGGEDTNSSAIADADLYNPASGLWTKTGSMTTKRSNQTATLLPNGKVLVAGGSDGNFNPQASAELYDPALGTWTATGSLTTGRAGADAMLLTNGLVLVTGGYGGLATAELYDPASGLWTPAATMHNQRQQFPAVLLPNGQVLVAGGFYFSSLTNSELYGSVASATLPIRLLNSTRLSSGAFQFGFTNTPGAGFTALTTTNLSLPLSDWSVIGSVPEISPGVFQFTDPQATNGPRHFYRVRSP